MGKIFRVKDLDSGDWVVKGADGGLSPTQHKNVATIFEGEAWLGYWQGKEGFEIIPLTETERLSWTGLNLEPPTRYNIKCGDLWVVAVYGINIQGSVRQSEAKIFTEVDLTQWRDKPGYEIVEVPNPFGIKGEVKILKLPGLE